MSRSRRSRRRFERQRARRPESRRLSPIVRLGLLIGGAVLIVAGAALLTAGGSANAARLGRLAGILILLGLVGVGVGIVGRL